MPTSGSAMDAIPADALDRAHHIDYKKRDGAPRLDRERAAVLTPDGGGQG